MKIEKKVINSILLIGGGSLLTDICHWALKNNFPIKVLTSERHSKEVINGTSLIKFLKSNKIDTLVSNKINSQEIKDFVGDTEEAFCLSLGAAWIFNKDILTSLFNNQLFNLHGTRLPQNRGGASFSWQILSGSRFGFCQLHLIDGGIDTGDIIASEEFLYPSTCRIPIDFEKEYIKRNLKFITKFIQQIFKKGLNIDSTAQSEYLSTYWPRLNTEKNGWIDWSYEISELEKFICAFDDPYPGALTTLNEKVVHLKKVSIDKSDGAFHKYQSGIIYRINANWLCIAANGGSIIIEEILDSKGKNIINEINLGDRFITNDDKLVSARKRVSYSPKGLKE